MVAPKSNTGSSLALTSHGLFLLLVIFGSFILETQATGKWNLCICCREGEMSKCGGGVIFLWGSWWWLMHLYTSCSTQRKNSIATCKAEGNVWTGWVLHVSTCVLVLYPVILIPSAFSPSILMPSLQLGALGPSQECGPCFSWGRFSCRHSYLYAL